MEAFHWLHYLDQFESLIVAFGLFLTAFTIRKDERARQISNMLAIQERGDHLWDKLFTIPALKRILRNEVDFNTQPLSDEESLFVKRLFLHLDTVRRASRAGMMVKIKGVKSDVKNFMSRPIPKVVWEQLKPFQDDEFVAFVENCLNEK